MFRQFKESWGADWRTSWEETSPDGLVWTARGHRYDAPDPGYSYPGYSEEFSSVDTAEENAQLKQSAIDALLKLAEAPTPARLGIAFAQAVSEICAGRSPAEILVEAGVREVILPVGGHRAHFLDNPEFNTPGYRLKD